MALNPIAFARTVNEQFRRYQLSAFPLADSHLGQQARDLLGGDPLGSTPLVRGPYLSLARAFEQGHHLADLADRGVIHPALAGVAEFPSLFAHQQATLEAVKAGKHVLVSTGTGSGKTESFLYPIIDHCLQLRDEEAPAGLTAVLIYPMNALATDQRDRLRRLLTGTGITFGMYIGATPRRKHEVPNAHRLGPADGRDVYDRERQQRAAEGLNIIPWEECASEEEITERKPRILITNAAQLELLLTRGKDLGLFTDAPLRFLVLDEAHTYSGASGAEVAVLMRRLRSFCGRGVDDVTAIATSATIVDPEGSEHAGPSFVSRLFGVPEAQVELVNEKYVDIEWPARRTVPPPPSDAEDLLRRILDALGANGEDVGDTALDATTLSSVVGELTGEIPDLGDDLGGALYEHLASSEVVPMLADVLDHPLHLDDAAAELWTKLRRSGEPGPQATAEILAYLALAAFAERDGAPLLRPKMHLFVRGLEGAAATFDGDPPAAQLHFSREDALELHPDRDPAAVFPVSVCRTCGQHYYTAHLAGFGFDGTSVTGGEAVDDGVVWRPSVEEEAGQLRFTDRLITDQNEDDPETAATEASNRRPLWLCRHCGAFHGSSSNRCLNPPCQRTEAPIAVQAIINEPGKFTCRACGSRTFRAQGRLLEPIRELRATTVSDVHILAQEMIDAAPPEEERLIIFSDNRQDAAFQAGWMRDHARRYRLRYLILDAIRQQGGPASITDVERVVEQVLRADLDLARALAPEAFQSRADEAFGQQAKRDLTRFLRIQVLRELTTSMTQIASLERWGLMRVDYADVRADVPRVQELATALGRPVGDVVALLETLLDTWRRDAMLYDADEPIFGRWWREGDEDVLRGFVPYGRTQRPPKGIKLERKDDADKYVRGVVSSKGLTAAEDLVKKWGVDDVRGALEETWSALLDLRLLTPAQLIGFGGRALPGTSGAMYVDGAKVGIVAQEQRWRCDTCQRIHSRLTPGKVCTKYRCTGHLVEDAIPADDYDVSILNRPFSMVLPEEHTGQVPTSRREQIEAQFKRGERVNTLVATPTLELGVDIGALDLVLCRNVPPTPANYWQRVGRAGRRRRMAVLYTYCRRAVHDSYFFEDPMRLLGAPVRPPRFNLKNDILVAKHTHAVVISELLRLRNHGWLSEGEEAVLDGAFPSFIRGYLFEGTQYRMQSPDVTSVAGLVSQHHPRIIEAVRRVFEAGWPEEASDEAAPDRLEQLVDETATHLQEVVDRLHRRFLWTVRTMQELTRQEAQGLLEPDEEKLLWRCRTYLKALRDESRSTYTLSVLAVEGYLPGYVTYEGGVTAFPSPGSSGIQFELGRAPSIAFREFVPGNLLYANRGRYRVSRFHFPVGEEAINPERYHLDLARSRIAVAGEASSGYADELHVDLEAMPISDVDLAYISPIRDEELERFQMSVATFGNARSHRRGGTVFAVGGREVWLIHGQGLRLINAGPADQVRRIGTGDGGSVGYPVCRVCGGTRSPYSSDAELEKFHELHEQRCGKRPAPLGFYADIQADTLRFRGLSDEADAANLGEALKIGASQVIEMEPEDLQTLLMANDDQTWDLYLYDPMPGGSGLLQQVIELWDELVAATKEVLEHCPRACESSCYDCLRTGRNVYWHRFLDRTSAAELLDTFGSAFTEEYELQPQTETRDPGDQFGTHPVEDRLAAVLRASGFDGFESQRRIEIGEPYSSTVPDFAYEDLDADVRVAIYLDGMSAHLHGSATTAHADAIIRDQLEDRGWTVVAIPASALDDPEVLKLKLKKVARALSRNDILDELSAGSRWYQRANEDVAAAEMSGEFETDEAIPDLALTTPAVAELVRAAVRAGADTPAIGLEVGPERWPIEAAWSEEKVGIVTGAAEPRDSALAERGWHLLRADGTTSEELTKLLTRGK